MGCKFVGGRAETAPTLRREGGVKTFVLEAPGKAVSMAATENQLLDQSGNAASAAPTEIRWAELDEEPLCQLLLERCAVNILGLPHEAWRRIQATRRVRAPDAPAEVPEPEDELLKSGELRGSSNHGRDPL